jgi:hypothetical protein
MAVSGIYKIQSKSKPERVYVGSAVNIRARWKEHKQDLKNKIHHSPKLQNHYNKYGKNDLVYSILLGCNKDELISNEQFFLDSLKPYFNICMVAYSRLGVKASEESRKRISLSKMGNKSNTGNHLSEETKQKISERHKGRVSNRKGVKLTEEQKRKISEAMRGEKNPMYGKPSPKKGKKGHPNPNKGKKGIYSEETLGKMRKSNKRAAEIRKLKKAA